MPDQEMMAAVVEALETALIVIIEDAHELAVASAPEAAEPHRERIAVLQQVGTDIALLAEACAVLLRRAW
jgi:hypothetical protein